MRIQQAYMVPDLVPQVGTNVILKEKKTCKNEEKDGSE